MTRVELKKIAEEWARAQYAPDAFDIYKKHTTTDFIAGFLAGRDIAANTVEPYIDSFDEWENHGAMVIEIQNKIKALGED